MWKCDLCQRTEASLWSWCSFSRHCFYGNSRCSGLCIEWLGNWNECVLSDFVGVSRWRSLCNKIILYVCLGCIQTIIVEMKGRAPLSGDRWVATS